MRVMSSIEYWVWLSSLFELSIISKAELLRHYGDPENIFHAPQREIDALCRERRADARALSKRDLSVADTILGDCDRQGLKIVTMQDALYPNRLKYIYAPPAVLYVKGRLPCLDDEAAIAVAGTRGATPYGIKMGRDLAGEIIRCGGIIVSGLTRGVDAAAAEGALLAGGVCVGVLGTAHERQKSELSLDVAARGALVGEYPPGMPNYYSHFRERNRITAGLSVGVVVVEAPQGSGALLLATEAAEQGKETFAVPGNADAPNSAGTIALMQEGAKPVTCGWDVMCEFAGLYQQKVHKPKPQNFLPKPAEEKKDIDKEKDKGYIDLREQLSQLSEDQLKIIAAIDKQAVHIDDIIEATGLGTAKVLSQLTILEIKGFVRRETGRRITLNTAKK